MDVKNSAGGMIKQINEALERDANNNLKSLGLTMSQLSVLLQLDDKTDGSMTLKEVEKALHCAQSTAHGLVTRLEDKGLIMSTGDSSDKRIRVIRITRNGKQICSDAQQEMKSVEDRILKPLSESEREIFLSCLSKVRNSLT